MAKLLKIQDTAIRVDCIISVERVKRDGKYYVDVYLKNRELPHSIECEKESEAIRIYFFVIMAIEDED